jgi:hypothetical protein
MPDLLDSWAPQHPAALQYTYKLYNTNKLSPTREINKILSTEMDVLRRSVGKTRLEKIKNENIKEIMGVKGKPDIIDIIEKKRLQWYGHVKRVPGDRIPKLILERVPAERRKRGRPRINLDGRSTGSHDSEKFRTKSMEKRRGMAFGFRKAEIAVIEPDRLIDGPSLLNSFKYRTAHSSFRSLGARNYISHTVCYKVFTDYRLYINYDVDIAF